jgi:N utilization substance protein B
MAEPGERERTLKDLLEFSWLEENKREALGETVDFSRLLITGAVENCHALDDMIKKHLVNWDFSRLNLVDRAVLRLSVYELLFQNTVPPSVVIDEAIDISREYGADDSYRFINGVLDGVRRTIQASENRKESPP